MGRTYEDLSGLRCHRLVAETYAGNGCWNCRCDCGRATRQPKYLLKSAGIKSCGCYRREWATAAATTHGGRRTPEYKTWCSMLERCYNQRCSMYAEYGARGIVVCDAWRRDFAAFIAHIGTRPSTKHSIDRIDVNGNYEPGNVRWALPIVQQNNRRNNVRLTHAGATKTLGEWAAETGLSTNRIWQRVHVSGYSPSRAITQPLRVTRRCHDG